MTDSLDAAVASLVAAVEEISDPVERYEATKELEVRIDLALKVIKAEVAKLLYDGRSWKKVGDLLGVTGSRAEQISRASR
jgi:DNA-directed RNA polymerase specialized sigma subunit